MVARSASGRSAEPGAEELDELADHAVLAQHLGDREHQVGGGGALGEARPTQAEADHLRDQHRDRLAEHRRLGLDAADAPAEDAEAVDHGGVGVGADQGVGIGPARPRVRHHHPRQVLEVDLVDDAGGRRHDAEVVEGASGPSAGRRSARGCARTPARRCAASAAACRTRRPAPSGRSPARPAAAGLILLGSPPIRRIASRMAARSTTAGTPVKSCSRTRAGMKAISRAGRAAGSQRRRASMSSARDELGRPRGAAGSRAGSSGQRAAWRDRSRASRAPRRAML